MIELKVSGNITKINRQITDGYGDYEIDGTVIFPKIFINGIDYYYNVDLEYYTLCIYLSTGIEYRVDCKDPDQIIKMIKRNQIIPKILEDEK